MNTLERKMMYTQFKQKYSPPCNTRNVFFKGKFLKISTVVKRGSEIPIKTIVK